MISEKLFSGNGRPVFIVASTVLVLAILAGISNLVFPPDSALHVPAYIVALLGKYLCYALLALSLDLVWGYAGILSLGHGAFFALGGYAMGMYLMRQIGSRGTYGNPLLPDFMVFLNWKELPWFWHGFDQFGCRPDGGFGARATGFSLRPLRLPQPGFRRLPFNYHAGAHLRTAARVFPQ